jgi:cysteine desulfurase/selenocysteine lyase
MVERGDVSYLDFAATSAVRPRAVVRAVAEYLENVGATPGRGGHRLAIESGRVALRCRQAIARLLGIPGDVGRIAFMFNATHALNTALCGVLRPRDRLVVTSFDHNAVLRPADQLARERGVDVRLAAGDALGGLDERALLEALDGARLLSINAASNVLGTTLDVTALVAAAHEAGALALVDTAQVAGHLPFDVAATDADLVAFTGHKGLLGPQGIGGLWVRPGLDIAPLLTGGTGGDSLARAMPTPFPDHLEAGTQNAPGIAGLAAGVGWLLEHGVDVLHARTAALKRQLHDGLSALPHVRVHSPAAPSGVPIVTITSAAMDPATLASRLDREHGVLTRPGLHCAPEAHRVLGTERAGAVRLSLGWCSTESDVERALDAVARTTGGGRVFASAAPAAFAESERAAATRSRHMGL